MLKSAAGTELSTAAAAQQSRYRTPPSGSRRQQTSTAVLATQTLPCAATGSSAVASGKNTAEDPQLRTLRPAVTSTAVEKIAGFGPMRGFDLLLPCWVTPPQQQIYACEHASHLLHDVLYSKKRVY